MKILTFFLVCLLSLSSLRAANDTQLRARADSAYAKEQYAAALELYLQAETSAATLYNIGNCYYRLDSLSAAILYYERALRMNPGDEDIKFNLTLAQGKTVDKVTPKHEFFFVNWYRSLCHLVSVDAWAYVALAAFGLALLLLGIRLFGFVERWKGLFTGGFVVMLLVCLLANLFAFSQRSSLNDKSSAIVMVQSTSVRSTPDQGGKPLFDLHAGTRVEIKDNSLKNWCEVELADGKKGWIVRSAIEVI